MQFCVRGSNIRVKIRILLQLLDGWLSNYKLSITWILDPQMSLGGLRVQRSGHLPSDGAADLIGGRKKRIQFANPLLAMAVLVVPR